jgi:ArsR family transcriptional regulator
MKQTAHLFKSLSEEVRIRILLLLHEQEELCICDLMAALELPQSTVSRHVAYLKNTGWLNDRRGGIWMYYSLVNPLDIRHRSLLTLIVDACGNLPDALQDRLRLQQYAAEKQKNCS